MCGCRKLARGPATDWVVKAAILVWVACTGQRERAQILRTRDVSAGPTAQARGMWHGYKEGRRELPLWFSVLHHNISLLLPESTLKHKQSQSRISFFSTTHNHTQLHHPKQHPHNRNHGRRRLLRKSLLLHLHVVEIDG